MIPNRERPSPVSPSAAPAAAAAAGRRRSDTELIGPQRQAAVSGVAATSTTTPLTPETEAQKTAEKQQMQWTEAICRNMDLPEGYAQVAVLIIKWAEHLDELKTLDEVEKLNALFRDDFHYETDVFSLDEKSLPQHQLIHAISGFLKKFDGPNNLLVIYYTGHAGYSKETGELEFYARSSQNEQCASWNIAETLFLKGTQADTLAILDTCYASNVTKGGEFTGRAYQLLAASGPDRMTAGPGHKSFTTAMIKSFKECLEENPHIPISLWKLSSKINDKQFRRQNPCFPHDRLKKHDRQILLSPLKKNKSEREENRKALKENTSVADLTLRFALGFRTLTKDHIEELTKELPKACRTAGVKLQRVDWVGFEERPVSFKNTVAAFSYAQHWLQKALPGRKRRQDTLQRLLDTSLTDVVESQSTQPDTVSISTGTTNIENAEAVNMHADTAIVNNPEQPTQRMTHRHNHHHPRNTLSDVAYARAQVDRIVSVNVGNMGPLTAAVISMGVLSCITTILCTRSALRT